MPRGSQSPSNGYKPEQSAQQPKDQGPNIYISNISAKVDEKQLKSFFDNFGDITSISLKKQQNFSFAFISFNRMSEATGAIDAAKLGLNLRGKRLKVEFCKPRKAKNEVQRNNRRVCYRCGQQGHIQKYCSKVTSSFQSNNLSRTKVNDSNQTNDKNNKNTMAHYDSSPTHKKNHDKSPQKIQYEYSKKRKKQTKKTDSSRSRSSSKGSIMAREKRSRSRSRSRNSFGARKSRLVRERSMSKHRSRS